MSTPAEIGRELERCSRCGSCMAVCPVYRETGEEGMVARGKLSLGNMAMMQVRSKIDRLLASK